MFTKKKKNLRYACISEANKGKKGCLNICPQHFETHLEEGSFNLQREEKGSEFLEEGSLEENSDRNFGNFRNFRYFWNL